MIGIIGQHCCTIYKQWPKPHNDFRINIKEDHQAIDWIGISGFRNRLVHGYLEVDINIVWSVIETHLPELKKVVNLILNEIDDTSR
ncbi:MAG: hypothetical protein CL610_01420 [Anaerolineaceae bacterium]|nr:hypothetical protein [Anaerolineaceae bacterium]